MMKKVRELSVFISNKPGKITNLCKYLADEKINIIGFTVQDLQEFGVFRLIIDNPEKAVTIFKEAGVFLVENEVLEIDLQNTPGKLFEVSDRLSNAGIDIEYAFGTSCPHNESMLYIKTSDVNRAIAILTKSGMN